ncbi:MAG: T9SS type A sorting domain-containing protein [Pedobacter sp.]|uniref:T9SS type A sorting domain-containing protein n=1 Tax=Pedobacter sp. TaxID=1411316 RepID=UPI0028078BB1|nr:T9SS type A sorting domain-containing protein [Pedobacter sp.]MDQ8005377.1 T9SS type A sorting domain-containing protein [Pedobacter sp.]
MKKSYFLFLFLFFTANLFALANTVKSPKIFQVDDNKFEYGFGGALDNNLFEVNGLNNVSTLIETRLQASNSSWQSRLWTKESFTRTEGLTFEGSVFIPFSGYKAIMVGFRNETNGTDGIVHGLYFFDNGTGSNVTISARNQDNSQNMPTNSYVNNTSPGSWFDYKIVLHSQGATYYVKRSTESNFNNVMYFDGGTNLAELKVGLQATTGSSTNYTAHKDWKVYQTNILYVNKGVIGGDGSGNRWANAFSELADALKVAKENDNKWTLDNPLEIWVAKGVYKPLYSPINNLADGQNNAFRVVKNTHIYGGFAGTEYDLDSRNLSVASNISILSGDINGDDIISGTGSSLSIGNIADNVHHVVVSVGDVGGALLNGFTISGGIAQSSGSITLSGYAIYKNCGGGVYCRRSSPFLKNVIVKNNLASSIGGGVYNDDISNANYINVLITQNIGALGGGISNDTSTPVFLNVTVVSNKATDNGGAIYNNRATPKIYNSILFDNISTGNVNIHNLGGNDFKPSFVNSLVHGSSSGNWNNLFGIDGGFNIDINPAFTNAANGDYTLSNASGAINMGDNALFQNLTRTTTDLLGNPRVYNFNTGGVIDLGAYEYQGMPSVLPVNLNWFWAQKKANGAQLAWQTVLEHNNKGFIIYRSDDNVNFIKIGQVVVGGATASLTFKNYSFFDSNPLDGNNYYKLLQEDKDGTTTVLGIKALNFQISTDIRFYPNPTSDLLTVTFAEGRYKTLTITDTSGKNLIKNTIAAQERSTMVSLANYSSGIYFVRLKGDNDVETRKLIKK